MSAQFLNKMHPHQRDGLIVLACVLGLGVYLLVMRYGYHRFGFPLDDAWIHQTYARNLARYGQWAFIPGQPSSGSTSVLWTLLIVPAHLLRIDPRWWTHSLGLAALTATALGAARLVDDYTTRPHVPLLVGLAVGMEWHLVWAAGSGMETGLFAAALIWFWVWVRRHDPAHEGHRVWHGFLTGVWGGILMFIRPEGVLTLGVAVVYGLLALGSLKAKLRWGMVAGLGLALLLLPFLGLNIAISGRLWPNTFYAKQTEYAVLWTQPYVTRFWQQVSTPFVGAQVLLVPGLLYSLWQHIRHPVDWPALLPWCWGLLHLGLYAARLPVIYQHGRYAMPVVPLIVIYGVQGVLLLARPRALRPLVRMASLGWMLTIALLYPLFLGVLGARAYAHDVVFIEDEMVATARWLAGHTAPDDVVAAHDIGAIGYFASHPLVDLAGLASPDVIPFIHDEQHLLDYMLSQDTDFLVIFPGWSAAYRRLSSDPRVCEVWSTAQLYNAPIAIGLGHMTVYRLDSAGNCSAVRLFR